MRRLIASTSLAAALVFLPRSAAAGPCSGITPPDTVPAGPLRALTAKDLIELRDLGPEGQEGFSAAVLAISPDARSVAFQLRRANIDSNDYCLAMFVVDLASGRLTKIDQGGDFMPAKTAFAGLVPVPAGFPALITPKWSPNGQWVAYLRRDAGSNQVWRARADGSVAEQVTHADFDIEDFSWSPDGRQMFYSGRSTMKAVQAAIAAEGQGGYLYDDRFAPIRYNYPVPREPVEVKTFIQTLDDGSVHEASPAEQTASIASSLSKPQGTVAFAAGSMGAIAWTTKVHPTAVWSPIVLRARLASGPEVACGPEDCDSVVGLWWMDDGKGLVFMRSEGVRLGTLALYKWVPGQGKPQRLFETGDRLVGCELASHELICADESSLRPRRIVAIDMRSGTRREVFDPNPEVQTLKLGNVQRLTWTNAMGLETWGDLVLPPDHKPGQRHPLIVVGYDSKGFLRGGTGDENPVFLYAATGYAVLSFQRPFNPGLLSGAATGDEMNRIDRVGWADRRSVSSSLNVGIDKVIALGVADPEKIGITGFSDGSSTVQFELVNSHRFAAAIDSQCCEDPEVSASMVGPALAKWSLAMGYPSEIENGEAFWRPFALSMNAAKVTTPLLLNLSDDEYLAALEGYTALRESGKPVEMYVFPNEHHWKWQPAHRMTIYQRNIDWFDFWLRGYIGNDPKKGDETARWQKLGSQW